METQLSPHGRTGIIIISFLTIVTTLFVGTRFWVRLKRKVFGIDDWLLSFALFMIYVQDIALFLMAFKGGMGRQFSTLSLGEMRWMFRMIYLSSIGYNILVTTIRLSILISLYRIFARSTRTTRAIYTLAGVTIAFFIAIFFVVVFQCRPVAKGWNPFLPGKCIDYIALLWANTISNNIIDWLVLFLPIIPVLKLQMATGQKALVVGSFLLGSLACIAGAIRISTNQDVEILNISGTAFAAWIWGFVEPCCAAISASLPFLAGVMGPKLRSMLGMVRSYASRSGGRSYASRSGTRSFMGRSGPSFDDRDPRGRIGERDIHVKTQVKVEVGERGWELIEGREGDLESGNSRCERNGGHTVNEESVAAPWGERAVLVKNKA